MSLDDNAFTIERARRLEFLWPGSPTWTADRERMSLCQGKPLVISFSSQFWTQVRFSSRRDCRKEG
jgi:hypothetical protein